MGRFHEFAPLPSQAEIPRPFPTFRAATWYKIRWHKVCWSLKWSQGLARDDLPCALWGHLSWTSYCILKKNLIWFQHVSATEVLTQKQCTRFRTRTSMENYFEPSQWIGSLPIISPSAVPSFSLAVLRPPPQSLSVLSQELQGQAIWRPSPSQLWSDSIWRLWTWLGIRFIRDQIWENAWNTKSSSKNLKLYLRLFATRGGV